MRGALEPGNPYGAPVDAAADAAGAGDDLVYVPVMLSAGDVAHYAASFDDGKSWHPSCRAELELEQLPPAEQLEGRKVTPCAQCQRWARQARRLAN